MSIILCDASIEPNDRVLHRQDQRSPLKERSLLEALREAREDEGLRERVRKWREEQPQRDANDMRMLLDLPPIPSVDLPNIVEGKKTGLPILGPLVYEQEILPLEIPFLNIGKAREARDLLIGELGDHALHIGLSPSGKWVKAFFLAEDRGVKSLQARRLFWWLLDKGLLSHIPCDKLRMKFFLSSDPGDLVADSLEEVTPLGKDDCGEASEGTTGTAIVGYLLETFEQWKDTEEVREVQQMLVWREEDGHPFPEDLQNLPGV